jgi:tetratricopeptide (TPR) repeat protein
MKQLPNVVTGVLVALLVGCLVARPAAGQPSARAAEPKEEFVAALRGFAEALVGSFGDEGGRVLASLDAMGQALERWDASIRENEKVAVSKGPNADTHQALAMVYLDRGRVDDALREFAAASQLDAGRPDVYTLQGLAYGLANRSIPALRAFQRAATLAPDDPRTSYRVALQLLRMGRLKEARDALDRFTAAEKLRLPGPNGREAVLFTRVDLLRPAVGVAPIFPPAGYTSGFASLARGQYELALAQFRMAAAADPLNADPPAHADPTARAAVALRQGQIRAAVELLKASLDAPPRRSEARRLLGIAYRADEQYENSVEQFKAAIELNPRDERSRIALADVYLLMGRENDAEAELKDAARVLPHSGQAHYGLGKLYRTQQRYSEALHEFELSAEAGPLVGVDYLLQAVIGIHFVQTNYDDAISVYRKRIELNPNNLIAHRELGRTYMEQGRHTDALAELMAAMLLKPDDADAFTLAGQCYLGMGRYADAADSSSRALALDQTQKAAHYVLGMSLTRLGRQEEGTRALQEFQRLQAEATDAANREWELKLLRQEAAASIDSQDFDKAARLLEQAVLYEPTAAALQTTLALVLVKAGRDDDAIEHFIRALDLNGAPENLRDLAGAYDRTGRHEEAAKRREAYERVKQERLARAGGSR